MNINPTTIDQLAPCNSGIRHAEEFRTCNRSECVSKVPYMEPSTNETIAANTRAELARRNEKYADLASAVGWTRATATRRLNASTDWTATDLDRVARHLGMTVTELMTEQRQAVAS